MFAISGVNLPIEVPVHHESDGQNFQEATYLQISGLLGVSAVFCTHGQGWYVQRHRWLMN